MSDRKVSAVTKELIEAKKKIEDEANWCTGVYIDDRGRMCALGALGYGGPTVFPLTLPPAVDALNEACFKLYQSRVSVVNDRDGHEAVMRAYDYAIQQELNRQ